MHCFVASLSFGYQFFRLFPSSLLFFSLSDHSFRSHITRWKRNKTSASRVQLMFYIWCFEFVGDCFDRVISLSCCLFEIYLVCDKLIGLHVLPG